MFSINLVCKPRFDLFLIALRQVILRMRLRIFHIFFSLWFGSCSYRMWRQDAYVIQIRNWVNIEGIAKVVCSRAALTANDIKTQLRNVHILAIFAIFLAVLLSFLSFPSLFLSSVPSPSLSLIPFSLFLPRLSQFSLASWINCRLIRTLCSALRVFKRIWLQCKIRDCRL